MNNPVTCFYYITHIDNVKSILDKGILSHDQVKKEGIKNKAIYDKHVLARRSEKWRNYANLYFNPRNPMLFRLINEQSEDKLAIIGVDRQIVKQPDVWLADGNVACQKTTVKPFDKDRLEKIEKQTGIANWTKIPEDKRKIMAEVLVPKEVKKEWIKKINVFSDKAYKTLKKRGVSEDRLIIEREFSFKLQLSTKINDDLQLIQGDMFHSRLQTLTISVNTVGVMGKGLASSLKWLYPNIYVAYQELCKRGKLKIGKPYLIKTDDPFYKNLVDYESQSLLKKYINEIRHFLMFPTKTRYQYPSKLEYIEDGLKWLRDNIKDKDDIKSIALPALGCGLGKLSWKDVGPLMGRYLHDLGKKVEIYLPAEGIEERYKTSSFLLSQVKS